MTRKKVKTSENKLLEEFSRLGQRLSVATTAKEAGRTIADAARSLFLCDGFSLDLYFPQDDTIRPILTSDVIDGKLVEISPFALPYTPNKPTPRMRLAIEKGGQLILRDKSDTSTGGVPFGNKKQLSASVMVVPLRHGATVNGTFFIHSYTFKAYDEDDLNTLQALADFCGGALERIRSQEALLESEEQLRALTTRLQSVREEESLRIAREIHDEMGQAMTGLKMDLQWMERRLIKGNDREFASPLLEKIQSMVQLTDQTIHSVRRIATELRPGMLDDLGLVPTLEWQARAFQSRTGITCDICLPEKPINLDEARATAVFRIFQEILTNIARHANATKVSIELRVAADALVLKVRDNGRGFDAVEIGGRKTLGLAGMRERAILFGGEIVFQSKRKKGTTVVAMIPLLAAS